MNQPNATYDHVFAIVRVDRVDTAQTPPDETVTVTKVVRTENEARQEVSRLNQINASTGAIYFWQITRLERQLVAP